MIETSSAGETLGAFAGYGVELEHMIVDLETLSVRPICDQVIMAECGRIESEIEVGDISWSNELVLHVIELKTNGPAATLRGLSARFAESVIRINHHLESMGAMLMPTGMHPWMDPLTETVLWPHEFNPVYEAFNRIFGCQGHGWSNLQSLHINLPFANDDEFRRLHSAIRLLMPIMPALAASTPIVEGKRTGMLDSRLANYRTHAAKIPSIMGAIIPEVIHSRAQYETEILGRIYSDVAPHDPEGILRDEWCNARGAIARFCRNTIEIRVLDVQECPAADLAITQLIVAVLRHLFDEAWVDVDRQERVDLGSLVEIYADAMRRGEQAIVSDKRLIEALNLRGIQRISAQDLWCHLHEMVSDDAEPSADRAIRTILEQGPLARRMLHALGRDPDRERLTEVYRSLCRCLRENRQFEAITS